MWNPDKRTTILASAAIGLSVALSACGYVDGYEEQVYDKEPVYCYKSLAATECFNEPYHRDKRRLVNYFGPHPSRYDAPPEPEAPNLQPPAAVDYWVKDPEPIPEAAPRMTAPMAKPVSAAAATPGEEGGLAALMRLIKRSANRPTSRPTSRPTPSAAAVTQPAPAAVPVRPVTTQAASRAASF